MLLDARGCAGRISPCSIEQWNEWSAMLGCWPFTLIYAFILHLFRTGMDERPPFDTAFFFSSFLLSCFLTFSGLIYFSLLFLLYPMSSFLGKLGLFFFFFALEITFYFWFPSSFYPILFYFSILGQISDMHFMSSEVMNVLVGLHAITA